MLRTDDTATAADRPTELIVVVSTPFANESRAETIRASQRAEHIHRGHRHHDQPARTWTARAQLHLVLHIVQSAPIGLGHGRMRRASSNAFRLVLQVLDVLIAISDHHLTSTTTAAAAPAPHSATLLEPTAGDVRMRPVSIVSTSSEQ